MSIWVEIRCNECNRIYGEAEYCTRENIAKLKAGARAEGWTITYKGNVICNKCKETFIYRVINTEKNVINK